MRKVDPAALYDKDLNTWIKLQGEKYRLGLTDWSQGYMGAIHQLEFHFLENDSCSKEALFVTVSSDKITSDVFLPLSCSIVKINEAVLATPILINEDCYGKGWLIELHIEDAEELIQLESARWYEDSIDSFFKKGS